MSLKKVDYINQETIIEAENLNDIQDSIIALEETGPDAIVNTASGEAIVISDSSAKKLAGLNIYGKSTQAGTPTPTAPVDIVSVGEDGEVEVTVGGEDRFVLMLPNGLRGIPVKDKTIATYTDSKGQMWCADEIDFARGVYVRRINGIVLTGAEPFNTSSVAATANYHRYSLTLAPVHYTPVQNGAVFDGYCSHYTRVSADAGYGGSGANGVALKIETMQFYVEYDTVDKFKSFLVSQYSSGTPVTVFYRLATPIETPLAAEQIEAYNALHTTKPNTTIINDENAYMTVKYIADPKSYIDNKVASAILAATVE